MSAVRQTNFLGGEVAPSLWGRTDLPIHARGLRTMLNFFPSHHGMAVSRPGTLYVEPTKYQAEDRPGPELVKLIPFVYADDTGALLVVGHEYIRCYLIQADGTPSLPAQELVAPWRGVDVRLLQWAQVGAVMTLTCPGYAPQVLTVTGSTFALSLWSVARPATLWVEVANQANPTGYPMIESPEPAGALFAGDADHRPMEWRWRVTATLQDADGKMWESTAYPVTRFWDVATGGAFQMPTDNAVTLYPDRPITLRRRMTSPGATYAGVYTVKAYNYYRGRGELFGYIGSTTGPDFSDDAREPDYDRQPPTGADPFLLRVGEQDRPRSVAYFENRLVFGGSTFRPDTLLLSAPGDFTNWDQPPADPLPGQALVVQLASRRRERIQTMLASRRLIIFTDSSVWTTGGAEPLTPATMAQFRVEDEVGSMPLPPLMVDGRALWVRSKGKGVRALAPDAQGGLTAVDLTWHASHLFQGGETTDSHGESTSRAIVDWCYQEDPWGLIWAVRDDGYLLSCTYSREGDKGWARHWLSGQCMAVASLPRTSEDVVYVVVRRGAVITLERLASRTRNDTGFDDVCTDGSRRSYAWAMDESVQGIINELVMPHLPDGTLVYLTAPGNAPKGPFQLLGGYIQWAYGTTAMIGDNFVSNHVDTSGTPTVVVTCGLAYNCDLELLDIAGGEARIKQKTVKSVGFEVDSAKGLLVGQDEQHLTEWRQRKVSDSWASPSAASELVVTPVLGTWDKSARAFLRQPLPLPVAVLGITREVDLGGS